MPVAALPFRAMRGPLHNPAMDSPAEAWKKTRRSRRSGAGAATGATERNGHRMTETVRERVVGIIAQQAVLEPSEVEMSASLDDLGIDSLGLVEAIFAIEEAFDISVPFNANNPEENEIDISSVAAIVAAVERLVADKQA